MATRIGTFRMDLGMALDQPGIKPLLSIYMNKLTEFWPVD
jgi:hypothetical protein